MPVVRQQVPKTAHSHTVAIFELIYLYYDTLGRLSNACQVLHYALIADIEYDIVHYCETDLLPHEDLQEIIEEWDLAVDYYDY
jgi:hypothetical protein